MYSKNTQKKKLFKLTQTAMSILIFPWGLYPINSKSLYLKSSISLISLLIFSNGK